MATGTKRKKTDTDNSPDKSEHILSKSLNNCGKKCTPKGESIQCNLCGTWAHASCEKITRDQYRVIDSLSSLDNLVYYCRTHNCLHRVKNIIAEWIKVHES